ncbi:MAG: Mur ligase domain-containing protein [Bacteroidales bacterium]|nr:Mur ligase domain-containing protein [Bacteroidales bacterium]MCF6342454.1 Mur ligase domain-containing protein [Bacteroidales bacterium]
MNIHFIAIGGSAMHNLAIALQVNGHSVSGSDDEIFEPSKSRLAEKGLLPSREGWFPENLSKKTDAVILGMHARPDNPELLRAQELGLNIYSYPEFLYLHAKDKKRVVIGGSHGKTTITGMVMHVLRKAGMKFDYLVGSKLKGFDVMVQLSNEAPIMIFEGDEYLSSPIDRRPKFHWYRPHIALLSGIAWDHINVFPTFENYTGQFQQFIELMESGGTLIYTNEDDVLRGLLAGKRDDLKKISYGLPVFRLNEGVTSLVVKDTLVPLQVFGKHNLMNLNGAKKVCNELGVDDRAFFDAIQSFEGTANRLELIGKNNVSRVFKDFAHAPSKVSATVRAVREQFPEHQLLTCLELHTFSSLNRDFIGQYAGCFDKTERACVYFNPHALRLKKLPELQKAEVKLLFANEGLEVFNDAGEMVEWLLENKQAGTVFLLMSSGNFDGIDLHDLAKNLI